MGQYHVPINLDKKEWIHPHHLDDGLKIREWGHGGTTSRALVLLLSNSGVARGGGDYPDNPEIRAIAGRWAGDRVVVVGDYSVATDRCEGEDPDKPNLYTQTHEDPEWTNISDLCAAAFGVTSPAWLVEPVDVH